MQTDNVVHSDFDRELNDLRHQLKSPDVSVWLEATRKTLPNPPLRRSTAEFVANARQVLAQVEPYMDAASSPNYESAPDPVKRVIELLFDVNKRECLFELMLANS
jgi:hypothetical protein